MPIMTRFTHCASIPTNDNKTTDIGFLSDRRVQVVSGPFLVHPKSANTECCSIDSMTSANARLMAAALIEAADKADAIETPWSEAV
jgi:hypothetical protein